MPTAPKARCLEPLCSAWAVNRGRCQVHTDRPWARPSVNTRTFSGRDRDRFRRAVLRRNPTCVVAGCSNPATEADHVIPLSQGGAHDVDNGQGLCATHHDEKTRAETAARNRARATFTP